MGRYCSFCSGVPASRIPWEDNVTSEDEAEAEDSCVYLKADRLVGTDEDADTQVVPSHNLCQPGILGR